jgi:hypothetical protein
MDSALPFATVEKEVARLLRVIGLPVNVVEVERHSITR